MLSYLEHRAPAFAVGVGGHAVERLHDVAIEDFRHYIVGGGGAWQHVAEPVPAAGSRNAGFFVEPCVVGDVEDEVCGSGCLHLVACGGYNVGEVTEESVRLVVVDELRLAAGFDEVLAGLLQDVLCGVGIWRSNPVPACAELHLILHAHFELAFDDIVGVVAVRIAQLIGVRREAYNRLAVVTDDPESCQCLADSLVIGDEAHLREVEVGIGGLHGEHVCRELELSVAHDGQGTGIELDALDSLLHGDRIDDAEAAVLGGHGERGSASLQCLYAAAVVDGSEDSGVAGCQRDFLVRGVLGLDDVLRIESVANVHRDVRAFLAGSDACDVDDLLSDVDRSRATEPIAVAAEEDSHERACAYGCSRDAQFISVDSEGGNVCLASGLEFPSRLLSLNHLAMVLGQKVRAE